MVNKLSFAAGYSPDPFTKTMLRLFRFKNKLMNIRMTQNLVRKNIFLDCLTAVALSLSICLLDPFSCSNGDSEQSA